MNYRFVPRQSLSFFAATLVPLMANSIDPTPTVVTGQVDFTGLDTHSAVINQQTQKAIVDYSHFNIPTGGSVQFIQPNSQSAILNRITGADPSLLNGSLTANGQIYFVNPAGVTFGPNSVIRADVFMAAAGQISNAEFLNDIQNFSLTGKITNHGSIDTENGVGLFGQQVENTGELVAKNGYAIVTSGDEVHVRQGGTGLTIDVTDAAKSSKPGTGIRNLGTVYGEEVMFSAGDAFATAIQQSGKVTARKSAKIHSDGGRVEVSGSVTARNAVGQGGRIEVGGTDKGASSAPASSSTSIFESAVLDASSDAGKGGHVVVWSDGHTDFHGQIDASSKAGEGGFIETSGKTIDFDNFLTQLKLGSGGHFLLDPTDITIDATLASTIESMLDGGMDFSVNTTSGEADAGDITVEANIQVPTNNLGETGTFTLFADRDIIVNSGVTIQNLQENFTPGQTVFDFTAGRDIQLSGDVRHSGISGETGRGSILLSAGNQLNVNNVTLDSNGGSLDITADSVILNGLNSSLVAGFNRENTASIDVTAASSITFAGGLIQTFGGTDVLLDTALLTNNTGASAVSRNDLSESFFGIRLPNPTDNGSGTNHVYNGIQSGSRALFNVTDFNALKTAGITGNRYYYSFQPTVGITANDGSKTYGNTFNLLTGGPAVTVNTGNFVQVPLGNPFLQDTTANALDLTSVTTSSVGATGGASVGSYPIRIDPDGAASNNGYAFNYLNGALTVNKRAITLTASQQNKQYGDVLNLDDTAFTVADLGNSADTTLPNGNVVDTVALNSQTGVDVSAGENAQTYTDEIKITGQAGSGGFLASNYDFTYVDADLVIDPRNVTVTASQQDKFYGDVLDLSSNASTAFTVLDNGSTNGGDAILPNEEVIDTVALQSVLPVNVAASTTENVGAYVDELRITGVTGSGGFDVNNYNLDLVDGNLIIKPRPITLTPVGQAKQYGDVLPLGSTAFTVLDNGLTNGGNTVLPNGEQIDTVVLSSLDGTAASTDADVLTYSDNIIIPSGGTYDSSNTSNGFNESNYEITLASGDLTINPRQIELIAGRQEKIYGDELVFDDTVFSVVDQGDTLDSALPNGEVITNVTIASATGVATSTTAEVSLYSNEITIGSAVTGTAGTGDGFLESNYDITYVSGDLLVKPRPITVTPTQQEKIYGNTLTLDQTAFTVTDLDDNALLPNGETIDAVNVISRGGHDASTTSSAVAYAGDLEATSVAASSNGFDLNNYTIDFSNLGDFVINRRAVTLTASQQEKDYGDNVSLDNTAFTVLDLDALLPNGETVDTVTLVSANGTAASTDADVNTYGGNISITPTSTGAPTLTGSNGFDQENYVFSYNTGDLVINKRAITLTASQQEKIYGNVLNLDDTAFTTLDRDGGTTLPNDEVVTNVTIGSATGVDASTSADVATYTDEITIGSAVTGTAGTGDGFLESNYDIAYVSGDLLVKPRPITVTPTQQEKIYGNTLTLDQTAFTVTDLDDNALLPNGETIDAVNVISRGGHDASTTSSAVAYAGDLEATSVAASSNGFDLNNYTIDFSNLGDFVINRRAVTLTASQQEKDYGDNVSLDNTAFTVLDLDNDALLPNGETVDTVTLVSANGTAASTDADVNTYGGNISITPTNTGTPTLAGSNGFDQENYVFSYNTGDLVVNKRAITLTASQQEKIYGNTLNLDDTAFTTQDRDGGTTLPNGEVVTNVTIASATGVDASTSTDVATYTDEITIGSAVTGTAGTGDGFLESNYDITYVAGDLKVNPRPITVTPTQQEKIYGNTLTLDQTAFTVTDLDSDALLPNGETIDTVNVISRGGHDTSTTSSVITYADDLEATSVASSSGGFDLDNYTIDFSNLGDFVINRRAVTLTALQQEKDYGDNLTLDSTSFSVLDLDNDALLPNGETVDTVSLVSANGTAASTDADVNTYGGNISITPTNTGTPTLAGSNGFDQENYVFSYNTGDLVVNKRAITLTASQQEKIYGNTLNLDDTAFTTQDRDGGTTLPNGEVVTNVTIASATGVDASTSTDVATYTDEITIGSAVTGTAGTGDGFLESNYDITYVAGDLKVNPRPITVTPTQQEKIYGNTLTLDQTAFTVTDLDSDALLPNGETIDTVNVISRGGHDTSTTSSVITYADDLEATSVASSSGGFDLDNYTIDFSNLGDFVINRRAVTLTALQQEKDYGDNLTLDSTSFSVLDLDNDALLPNGETVDTVSLVSANGTAASTDADVNTYGGNISITPTNTGTPTLAGSNGFDQENYVFSYNTGDLVVNKRAITLTASQQEKIYGNTLNLDDTAFTTQDRDGGTTLPNGEVVTNVTIASATGVDASTSTDVATYTDEITIGSAVTGTAGTGDGFLESNYDITYVAGDLKVNPRPITVTPTQQEKIYGNTLTLDQTAFTVTDLDSDALLPNGETIDTVNVISRGGHDASTTSSAVAYAGDLEATSVAASSNGFDLNNYTIDFSNLGDFVINRRAVTLTASQQEKDYGDNVSLDNTAFTVLDLDNDALLPNGETVDTVTLVSANGTAASTDADVNTYGGNISITPTSTGAPTLTGSNGFDQENYVFSYNTGDLVINKRAITLTASQQEKIYGNVLNLDDTAFTTLDRDGGTTLPNDEVVTNVTIGSATGVDASTSADVATYTDEITIGSAVTGTAGTGDGFLESNYDITYVAGDLKVNPRPITVTPTQQEKIYGNTLTLDQTAFTVTDLDSDALLPNGETIDTVNVISRGGHDTSTTSSVITYADDLEATSVASSSGGFDLDNYTIDFSNLGDFVINRRAVTLTALQQEKDYGDNLTLDSTSFSVLDLDNDALLPNGETVDTVSLVSANGTAASTDADVNTYGGNISITPTNTGTPTLAGSNGFDQENYVFSYNTGDLVVNKRAITLTASQQEKIYGNTLNLDDTAFTTQDRDGGTTLPNGEVVTNVTIASATGVDASTSTDVATYTDEITIGSAVTGTAGTGDGFLESNYDITYVAGDLKVNPRPITVTPTQQEKIYGNTLTLDQTAFTVTDLDSDALLPNGETIDAVNVISRGGHDASTTSSAVAYAGDLEATSVASSSGGFDLDNYTIDFSNLGDFVINRRAVTLTASQQEKDYGDNVSLDNTAFTVLDLDNDALLPNGETVDTVTLVSANGTAASTDADVNTYGGNISITPTNTGTPTLAGSNGFDQENYVFSYNTGDLVVNKRAITLTASQQEKIYGNTLNLDDTAFTTQDRDGGTTLPNGEVVTNVTIASATGVDASTSTDVATYTDEITIGSAVTGTAGTGDGFLESNYDITYVAGDLKVNPRPITVTALAQEKTYGESITPSTSEFSVTNLANSESIDTVTITSSFAEDSSANVETYTGDLSPTTILTSSGGFSESNYDVTRVDGAFTINKRVIRLTAQDQEKIYGNTATLENNAFTVLDTFGGGGSALPNGESIDTVTFVSTIVPGDTTANVGTYNDEINISGQAGSSGFLSSNYDIAYSPGDYTISRRAVDLVISSDKRFAGALYQIDPTAFTTIDLDGDGILPNGETIDSLAIMSANGVAEDPAAPFVVYPNELVANPASALGSKGFSLANYNLTVIPGDFEIEPFSGLSAIGQDLIQEQWILDNIGYDLTDPFANTYAISQSIGLRLIELKFWAGLSPSKKKAVLTSLDAIPLHLQTLDQAEKLIEDIK